MAFGQKQVLVAIPQPGTSNLPYAVSVPKGGLSGKFGNTTYYPPFAPVTVSVTDYYGSAILYAQTEMVVIIAGFVAAITGKGGSVMEGTLSDIANKLAEIDGNLYQIMTNYKTMVTLSSKIETNLAAIAANKRQANNIAVTLATSKIQTNDFFKIYDGETPQLRGFTEIIKEKIKEASSFRTMMKVEGMVNQALEDTTEELQNYFKLAAKEFGITKYIQDKVDSLKSLVPDPKAIVKFVESKSIVTGQSYGGLG
jgi:hypothetical protein